MCKINVGKVEMFHLIVIYTVTYILKWNLDLSGRLYGRFAIKTNKRLLIFKISSYFQCLKRILKLVCNQISVVLGNQ